MYFIYILRCKDGSLYTGITNDVARRFEQHKRGQASRYTRAKGAGKIVYTEKVRSRGVALQREAEIKRWPRKRKLSLL